MPVAHAVVRGSSLKADVVLRCATAETVDEHWIASLGPETMTANVDASHQVAARPDFDWDDEDEPASAVVQVAAGERPQAALEQDQED